MKLMGSTKNKITKDKNGETLVSEFSYIKIWFIDQNSKQLEIEDKKQYFI